MAIDPGLNAIYGLNGAGKSWVLRLVQEASSGLVRTPDSYNQVIFEADLTSELGRSIAAAASLGLTERDRENSDYTPGWAAHAQADELESVLAMRTRSWLVDGGDAGRVYRRHVGGSGFFEVSAAIEAELLSSTCYSLVATGSREPRWEVWKCLTTDSLLHPAFAKQAKQELEAVLRVRAGTHPDYDGGEYLSWARLDRAAWGWTWLDARTESIDNAHTSELWDFYQDGLPIPVAHVATLTDPSAFRILDADADVEIDRLTGERFAEWLDLLTTLAEDKTVDAALRSTVDSRSSIGMLGRDGMDAGDSLSSLLDRWSSEANEIYASLLQDAPPLSLVTAPARDWLVGSGLVWTSGGRPVEALSRAQTRWAKVAIRLVLHPRSDLILLDEPEAALHRSAEAHMSRGLATVADRTAPLLVATHSPMLLDERGVHCIEVRSETVAHGMPGGRSSATRPLRQPDRDSMTDLGLQPSDLLRRERVFVLVEGVHDEIVLQHLLADTIRDYRARIIPVHGARNLAAVLHGRFLFDYTDAHLVTVMDNLSPDRLSSLWFDAQYLALTDVWGAIDLVVKQLPDKASAENRFIREWLTEGLRSGLGHRITPLGLAKADIIEYLPVSVLLPNTRRSWEMLREEWADATPTRNGRVPDFKTWLKNHRNALITPDEISRAVEAVDPVPADIERVGIAIRELGSRPH